MYVCTGNSYAWYESTKFHGILCVFENAKVYNAAVGLFKKQTEETNSSHSPPHIKTSKQSYYVEDLHLLIILG